MKYTYPLLACTFVMLQASLYAEDAPAKRQKEPRKEFSAEQRQQFRMKMLDKNGDGKIDEQERAAGKAKHEEMVKKFDKNGDGRLDGSERQAMHDARKDQKDPAAPNAPAAAGCKCEKMMKKFDKNNDGKLDEQERAAAEAHREAMMKKCDKNGDGKVDAAERQAMQDDQKAENDSAADVAKPDPVVKEADVKADNANAKGNKDVAKKGGKGGVKKGDRIVAPAVLKAFDKDADGTLSKEERDALRATRKTFDKDGDGKLNPEERKAMHDSLAK